MKDPTGMKILGMVPALGKTYGGTSKVPLMLAAALGRRGVSVDLIATNADGPRSVGIPIGHWIAQDGYRLRCFSRLGTMEYKPSPAMMAWLWRHVREYALVHIHSNFNFPVLATALVCRLRGVPYLVTPHGMLEPWALQYKGWKKMCYYRWIERPFVLRGAAALQALNRSEAANVVALKFGPPVVVLGNGIDPSEAAADGAAGAEVFLDRFPTARGRTLILFLHRVDPKKGLDILAKAYGQIREKFPRSHVIVAGPDGVAFTGTARGFFEAAGCADAVTFTGPLDGAVKHGALAAASVFVAPSYSEGFSMSVLEAMAAGLPCVLTEGCNFPEAGEADAARIVPTGDAGAFAGALGGMLGDPAAARAMGRRARALVLGRYTWAAVAASYEEIVAGLSSAPGHPPPAV